MSTPFLELWGGIECTVARIGDGYRDQVAETEHDRREGDLDLVADLGIRTLRYPLLWETVSPDRARAPDWSWHDRRLRRLQALGMRPIAGLLHHGSGPRDTSLVDPDFPGRFARHAAAVADRYPWIDRYTPVNEPLTTARFSCLYGHWYPHGRQYGGFLTALVAQCRATMLAMREIRRINPAAQLVQTEDFGRVFSTSALAHQAEHENERRWLSFDLLLGRVDRHHPWWRILTDHEIAARDLDALLDREGAPDILGINHYLTGERFLDERTERYPAQYAGGNGRERYADVEAVRVELEPGALGPAARLREVWERYGTPIAVTEVHHGCTRDEQLRWFVEVWRAAETVRREGADVRAVTAWAMFGAVDWNSLLTRRAGIYEPGVFDTRGPAPRPTAIAIAARDLARSGETDHPVLDGPGWWHRPERFHVPPETLPGPRSGHVRAILVTGPDGALRRAILTAASARGLAAVAAPTGAAAADATRVAGLRSGAFWAVVETGSRPGYPGPDELGALCHAHGRRFLSMSDVNDLDAFPDRPATEDDGATEPGPATERETRLRQSCPGALLVRTGPLFGPGLDDSLVSGPLDDLARGTAVAAGPELVSPTYLPDLAHVALDLLVDGETGVRHLTGGAVSRAELVRMLEAAAKIDPTGRRTVSGETRGAALDTVKGRLMPPLASAIDRFVSQRASEQIRASIPLAMAAE